MVRLKSARRNRKLKARTGKPPVLLPISTSPGKFVFFCPGCQANHVINTSYLNRIPVHTLTGTMDKPTIRASVLSKGDTASQKPHCHSYITAGRITFLSDCTHQLAGQTVQMVAI